VSVAKPEAKGNFTETTVSSRLAYDGSLLKVKRDEVRLPDGHVTWREYVLHPGAVMVLAFVDPRTLLLERQYRYPKGRHFIELPAGKLEPGEEPLATARRELIEECGYEAREWTRVMTIDPCIGYSNEVIHLYAARGPHARGREARRRRAPRDFRGEDRRCRRVGARRGDHRHQDHDRDPLVRALRRVRPMNGEILDLLVVGGGINGAGHRARRGGPRPQGRAGGEGRPRQRDQLWSSKLIHGGLRYLEQYEFRLVREALREREVLLRLAPHIIRPLLFVLPHDATMRPVWMIRCGLFLYDHLGGRITLPGSKAVSFPHLEFGAGFKGDIRNAFVYSDCRVDDARLTLLNALSAQQKGASVHVRTRFERARRVDGAWEAEVSDARGDKRRVSARALVNAGGPWVMDVLDRVEGDAIKGRVRLVKGSHIIVPKVHSQGHAWILQNPDKRVAFVIPYEGKFSLIGTTDVAVPDVESARGITLEETDYLIAAVNRYLAKPIVRADIVSSYAGVRPLYDDGSANPSEVTRDYVLKVDHAGGKAALLTVFGGKLTTYRCLAEETMEKLEPFFPGMKGRWTSTEALPAETCRTSTASATRCTSAIPSWGATWSRGSCGATARALPRCSRARGTWPTWGATSAAGSPSARSSTCARTSGPPRPRTCCGAAPSAACT
jgi:glycerol-3-phosphate dehydrogenase